MIVRIPAEPFPWTRHLTLAEVDEWADLERRAKDSRLKVSGWTRLIRLRKRKVSIPEAAKAGSAASRRPARRDPPRRAGAQPAYLGWAMSAARLQCRGDRGNMKAPARCLTTEGCLVS